MTTPKILAFSGSTRVGSVNSLLVMIAAAGARQAGAEVTYLNLDEYPLPLFNQDLEQRGTPENLRKLQQLFVDHEGFLISSPEYNSSITPLLKNTIDWVSRPTEDLPGLAGFQGKYATLMAASPGALGGLRGLNHVRDILGNIGVTVLPQQVAVGQAFDAFTDTGDLKNESQQQRILDLGANLAILLAKLKA
ncbi:FMN-dependent NADPH-azoreductase [Polystyrenella longa]|uniref:FMN-dependent NADPH-azoreductase n=1 Tax=Polystyrenella longa TaxID=2528007 RepID=A0A518CI91_9PLAN|nr:NAD(P)H-dependent oxidoreductase [Polystyrenella longa]QDU78927.1 FMN-dependent NADPH-azoreductase [Polystyrenella longa]